MRLRALKILRGKYTADPATGSTPADEFDCDDAADAAELLDAGAAEPVRAEAETAAEQVSVETADEAPAPPEEAPRKRVTKPVNPKGRKRKAK